MSGYHNHLGLALYTNQISFPRHVPHIEGQESSLERVSSTACASQVVIEIKSEEKEALTTKGKVFHLASNALTSSRTILGTNPVETHANILDLIRKAERAFLERDSDLLRESDLSLAGHLKNTFIGKKTISATDFSYLCRIFRLGLPETNALLVAHMRSESEIDIQDDSGTLFSDLLDGRPSNNSVEQVRERIFKSMNSTEKEVREEAILGLAEAFLKNRVDGENELQKTAPGDQFAFLLDLLSNRGSEETLLTVFSSLVNAAVEGHLSKELLDDFVQIAKEHSDLQKFLGEGADEFKLKVKDSTSNAISVLSASRLLLSHGSAFFRTLVKKESIEENGSRVFGLEKTSFDCESVKLFLHWLRNPHIVSFNNDKVREGGVLERFLLCFSAFSLTNEAEFLEKIQLNFAEAVEEDTLKYILGVSLYYNLQLVTASCIDFINDQAGGHFQIHMRYDGSLQIEQGMSNENVPPFLLNAVELLGPKINSAIITTTVEDRASYRFPSFGKMGRCTAKLGSALWYMRGIVGRTSLCYAATLAIPEFRDSPPMSASVPISVIFGAGYPLVAFVFQKCVINPCMIGRPLRAVTLPGIVPLSIQRSFFVCAQKIKNCARKGLKSAVEKHPLLSSLPKKLSRLDLSSAVDLTDDILRQLVFKHENIERLELTTHPLTKEGYACLALLQHLKHLRICIKEGDSPGSLNELNLNALFGNRQDFKFELEITDYTLAYYDILPFLSNLPSKGEIHISLGHVPVPNSMVFFESHQNVGEFTQWPGAISHLVEACPRITHLKIGMLVVTDNDLVSIAAHCTELRSLKVQLSQRITHVGLEDISSKCKNLEELSLDCASIDDESVRGLVIGSPQLKSVEFTRIVRISDEGLQHLSSLKNLEVCLLRSLPSITDEGVQFLLNHVPVLKDLRVKNCTQITNGMLLKLFERPSSSRMKQMDFVKEGIRFLNNTRIPLLLVQKTAPPLLFQFFIDNLVAMDMNIKPGENMGQIIRKGLQLPQRSILVLRISQLKALAHLPLNSLKQRIQSIISKNEKELYDIRLWSLLEHALVELSPEKSPKIEAAYIEFLRATYSKDYVTDVISLIKSFKEELKNFTLSNAQLLKLGLPALYEPLQKNTFLFHFYNLFVVGGTPQGPLKTLLESILAMAKGKNWTDDKKCAAFLGIIFSDWSENSLLFIKKRGEEEKQELKEGNNSSARL